MLRRFARLSRSFTTTPLVRSTPPSKVELQESIPGFRKPGVVATDYEVAAGLERYELLKTLKGEDPWTDLHPIEIKEKGTVKNPILVTGVDSERYIGCTADSHPIVFLTLRPHEDGQVDRCVHCGNVFKYIQEEEHH